MVGGPWRQPGPGKAAVVSLAMPKSMRVPFIAAESEPWAKTGGLADVVDALARALGQIGGPALDAPVDVFLPRYRGIAVPEGAVSHPLRVPDPVAPDGASDVSIVDVEAD